MLPTGFTRRTVRTNGTDLSVVVGGSGDPVLLLHGWPETGRCWRHLLEPLADHGHTVIVPDLRGLGRSARAEHGYAKDDQARDMRELLRRLQRAAPEQRRDERGEELSVSVVGHDIGGMVAFSYARQWPDEVARLALLELAVPGFGLEEAMDVARGGRWHFGLFMTPEVPELLLDGHERAFFRWWFATMSGDPATFTPEEIDRVTDCYRGREALRAGFAHYRTLLADGRVNRAWGGAGGRLPMPVLAVGGELAVGTRLADSIRPVAPDTRAAVIPGSGHFLAEERPEPLTEQLTAFLATPPGAVDTSANTPANRSAP